MLVSIGVCVTGCLSVANRDCSLDAWLSWTGFRSTAKRCFSIAAEVLRCERNVSTRLCSVAFCEDGTDGAGAEGVGAGGVTVV